MENTRPNVSCDGMPFASRRNVRSQVEPFVAEAFDIGPAIGAGDRAAKRDDDQVEQFVPTGALNAQDR